MLEFRRQFYDFSLSDFTNSIKKMHVKSIIVIIIENISVWMNAHVWSTSEVHSNQGKLIEKLKDGIAICSKYIVAPAVVGASFPKCYELSCQMAKRQTFG